MKIEETISGGFNEINIIDNCDFELFYTFSDILKEILKISYLKKIHDYDTIYWGFEYENVPMILHYSTFLGIIIYPSKVRQSSVIEYNVLDKIFDILKSNDIPDSIK